MNRRCIAFDAANAMRWSPPPPRSGVGFQPLEPVSGSSATLTLPDYGRVARDSDTIAYLPTFRRKMAILNKPNRFLEIGNCVCVSISTA